MLARQCGRWDWWNIRDEHSPYEWAVQRLLYAVDPFGPERDDARHAWNTVHDVARTSMNQIDETDLRDLLKTLRAYLKCQEDPETEIDMAALQKVKQHAEPR